MENNIFLYGRPTTEIELKTNKNGKEYCNFTLASNISYGENKETLFLKFRAYNGYARSLSKVLKVKGRVMIQGSLRNNNYTNEEGQKVYEIYALVQGIDIIDFASKENSEDNQITDMEQINPFQE